MAFFTDYTTLQATIADYLARSDLTTQIPEFIRLAEDRLLRDLRIRQMIKVATASTTAGDATVSLPSDFLAMKDLHLNYTIYHFHSTTSFYLPFYRRPHFCAKDNRISEGRYLRSYSNRCYVENIAVIGLKLSRMVEQYIVTLHE